MNIWLSVVIAGLTTVLTSAEIFKYSDEQIQRGAIIDFGLSLIAPSEGTHAQVVCQLKFDRNENDDHAISVAAVGMKPEDIPRIQDGMGIRQPDGTHFCCDERLIESGKCNSTEKDLLVFNKDLVEVFTSTKVPGGKKDITFEFETPNTVFGMLVVGDCPPSKLGGSASMSGQVSVQHNYGMLSPLDYPYLPFYGYMIAAYCLVAIIWGYFNMRHKNQLMQVQQAISCVIALCCIEMFSWYSFYSGFNRSGIRQSGPFSFALITSSVRRAVSRMLVVAVSLGFGVSKPSLGAAKCKVLTAGVVYMFLEAMLQLKQHIWTNTRGAHATQGAMWLMVPVTLMDSAFYWWIFVSLSETLEDLRKRRQPAKYAHMRSFAAILFASLAVVTIFSVFRIYFVESLMQLRHWNWTFLLFDGFAQIMYLLVLVGIAYLWKPGPNSRSIAYAEQVAQNDFDDEFDLELKDNVTAPALGGNKGTVSRFAIGGDDEDDLG